MLALMFASLAMRLSMLTPRVPIPKIICAVSVSKLLIARLCATALAVVDTLAAAILALREFISKACVTALACNPLKSPLNAPTFAASAVIRALAAVTLALIKLIC